MIASIKILLILTDPDAIAAIVKVFEQAGYSLFTKSVNSKAELVVHLKEEKQWDAVIGDYFHPKLPAVEAINTVKGLREYLPFFVLAKHLDFETTLNIMHQGASDYILYQNFERLVSAFMREQAECRLRKTSYEITQQLDESHFRFQTIFRNSNKVIFIVDADTGRFIDVNEAACNFYSYTYEEFVQLYIWEINTLPEEKILKYIKGFRDRNLENLTTLHKLKNGEIRSVEISATPYTTQQGIHLFTIVTDKTAQQKAEKNLQDCNEKLHSVLNYHHQQTALLDLEGNIIKVNQAMLELIGVGEENLTGIAFNSLPIWKYSANIGVQIQTAVKRAANGENIRFETFAISKGDQTKTIDLSFNPVRNASGTLMHIVVTGYDISAPGKIEKETKKSQSLLGSAINNLPFDVWITDKSGNYILQNSHSLKNSGDHINKHISDITQNSTQKKDLINSIERVLQGEPLNIEITEQTLSGKKHLKRIINPLIVNEEIAGTIGVHFDITEYRNLIDDLIKGRERLVLGMEATEEVLWDYHLGRDDIYLSPKLYSLLGYETDELTPSLQMFFNNLHPDDLQHVMETVTESISNTEATFEITCRMRKKSGHYVWIETKGKIIGRNADRLPLRVVGTSRDISQRKETESELIAKEKKFSMLFLQNPIPQFIWKTIEGEFILDLYNIAGSNLTEVHSGNLYTSKPEQFAKTPQILADLTKAYNTKTSSNSIIELQLNQSETKKRMELICTYISPEYILMSLIPCT